MQGSRSPAGLLLLPLRPGWPCRRRVLCSASPARCSRAACLPSPQPLACLPQPWLPAPAQQRRRPRRCPRRPRTRLPHAPASSPPTRRSLHPSHINLCAEEAPEAVPLEASEEVLEFSEGGALGGGEAGGQAAALRAELGRLAAAAGRKRKELEAGGEPGSCASAFFALLCSGWCTARAGRERTELEAAGGALLDVWGVCGVGCRAARWAQAQGAGGAEPVSFDVLCCLLWQRAVRAGVQCRGLDGGPAGWKALERSSAWRLAALLCPAWAGLQRVACPASLPVQRCSAHAAARALARARAPVLAEGEEDDEDEDEEDEDEGEGGGSDGEGGCEEDEDEDEEDSEEEGEAAEDLVFPAEFAPALVQLLATAPDAAPAPAASGSGGGGGAGGGAGRPLAVRAIALPDPELQLQVAAALWEAGVLACVPPPVPAKPAAAKAKAVAKPAKAAAAKAVPIAAQQAKAAGKPGKQAAAQQAAAGKGGGKAGGGEPAAAGGRKKQRKA